MSILSTLGLSADEQNRYAASAKTQANTLTRKAAGQQEDVLKSGYAGAEKALAPALTNIGNIYNQAQTGADVRASAYGLPGYDPSIAKTAYANFTQPVNQYGIEDLFRYAGQTGTQASGNTQRDLYDYGYQTRYKDWLAGIDKYDPLAANSQNAQLGEYLAGQRVGQGQNLSTVYGNKFDNLRQANVGYQNQLATNAGNVAQNWGSLAKGVVNAGVSLAGMGMGIPPIGLMGGGGSQQPLPTALATTNTASMSPTNPNYNPWNVS